MVTPYPKDRLLSDAAREALGRGQGTAVYRLTMADYDRAPDRTFLVRSAIGTGGWVLSRLTQVVKVRDIRARNVITPRGRVLFTCWTTGQATRLLDAIGPKTFDFVIYPGEPGHDMLEAFKVACDTRRVWADRPVITSPALLYKALDLPEPSHSLWYDDMEYQS